MRSLPVRREPSSGLYVANSYTGRSYFNSTLFTFSFKSIIFGKYMSQFLIMNERGFYPLMSRNMKLRRKMRSAKSGNKARTEKA